MTILAVAQPTVTRSTPVDVFGGTLSYCSNTALVKFAGLYWLFMDGSATGYAEASNDQSIWCVTSADAATWSTPFRPFRDSGQASNPLTTPVGGGAPVEWQPGPVVVGAELWVFWTGGSSTYRSRRGTTGAWTNERLLWNTSTGAASWSTTSLEGAAPAGHTLSPTVAGISTWRIFVASSPLVLTSGTVAVPVTLQAMGSVAPDAPVEASSFVKEQKRNAVLRVTSDASATSLSAPVALGEWGGNFGAWEPTLVQGDDGVLRMFSRNLNMSRGDGEMLLVSASSDEGATWTATRNTHMQVPTSRPFARQVATNRWALVHCDNPSGSTLLPNQSFSGGRLHGTVFTSRQGVDNFVPGVPFSAGESSVHYPQILADGNDLLVNYTVNHGDITLRRYAVVARIAGINDPDTAYIGVRERRGAAPSASSYSGGILRLTGGLSAGVELAHRRQTLTLKWRLGQTTAATRYPILTVGNLSNLVRVEVDSRDPNYLRVNGARVGTSIDPTTWQTLTLAIEGRRATIAGVTIACGGLARLYLGPAEPPAAVPAADWVEYDVASSVIVSND